MAEYDPEKKKEISKSESATAEKDVNRFDAGYLNEVGLYFENSTNGFSDQEHKVDSETQEYAQRVKDELSGLAYQKYFEHVVSNPEKIALALAELGSTMLKLEPTSERETGDLEYDGKMQRRYELARKLFFEICAKIFPDKKEDIVGANLLAVRLRRSSEAFKDISEVHPSHTFSKNPEKFLDELNAALADAGYALGHIAYESIFKLPSNLGAEYEKEVRQSAAYGAELIYELSLSRDAFKKRIESQEQQRVDKKNDVERAEEIRKELKGEKKVVSPEGAAILQKLSNAVSEELARDKKATGIVARQYQPAMDAFRFIFSRDDIGLAERFSVLIKKVGEQEQKLLKGGMKDPVLAHNKAFGVVYNEDLTPDERQALEDASSKDAHRQEEKSRELGGIVGYGKVPSSQMFEMLMKVLVK